MSMLLLIQTFVIILSLFMSLGCSNKKEFTYLDWKAQCDCCPSSRPPMIYIPYAPSDNIVTPNPHNFIPHFPIDSQIKLNKLLTNNRK